MESIRLRLGSRRAGSALVEQGVPVSPMTLSDVERLRITDERSRPVRSSIEPDGRDEHGRVTWVRVAARVRVGPGRDRMLTLDSGQSDTPAGPALSVEETEAGIAVETPCYRLSLANPGRISLSTNGGDLLSGDVRFQLWPDARSIVGAGAGTCRLADFEPGGWSVEERGRSRCLVLLRGRVPKFAPYTSDPSDLDPRAQFDCELELVCYSFAPVIRYRWRVENHTVWQAYLERYALVLPLAPGSANPKGQRSRDGKFLRHVTLECPGGRLSATAGFVDALGPGAGINVERRMNLGELSHEQVAALAGGRPFEPHRYLAAGQDDGAGLDLVVGGVNPPHDGRMTAANPEVHRLFYLGMGRTFDGSILVDSSRSDIGAELNRVYFEIEPDYYSCVGALPEGGDPVSFGDLEDRVFATAEWMLARQWRGTLWWGEWWREFDVLRDQGIESTANGNNALAPLYHYWRTGDDRFVDCAKRAMEFAYDVQLSKRRTGLGSFFQSRRFLIDRMEWVHMRYQRIEGIVKTAHFLGDRRLREKTLDAMKTYARKLVCPNGAPGYGSGGPDGKRVVAGSDCTNFGEVLVTLWRETGEAEFLDMAKKMARWTIRAIDRWDWDADVGNSYGWHFPMRGMLAALKATGNRRFRNWYLEMARRNMTYDISQIGFVHWMNWLVVEAEKLSGEAWMLDVLRKNTLELLSKQSEDGGIHNKVEYPWSKWPTRWEYIYDAKGLVAYVPVMTARRRALGLPD